jgi:DHA1 family inner membrane transport protein
VRIGGYGWIVRFYDKRGDRPTCTAAIIGATICGIGYATLSGFWLLLPLRLIWGMVFGALNLSAQVLSTAEVEGSGRRAGASRGYIALVPTIALPLGALMTHVIGIRLVFAATAVIAIAGLLVTRKLPSAKHKVVAPPSRRLKMPDSLDIWSFVEGFTLDGLFIIGLSYLAVDMVPSGAVVAAAVLMALRYLCEIVLSPIGGRMSERFGAEPMLIFLSLITAVALVCFGAGFLLAGAGAIVVLRALQLPLIAPIVAARNPGPERIRALTARSLWRDIGAGTGPLVAGFVLPVASSLLIYSVAGAMLAASAWACRSKAAASMA